MTPILFAILTALHSLTPPAAAQSVVTSDEGITPIRTLDAASMDDRDLAEFDRVTSGARLIGIGESVHGSSGYLKLYHRLIRHLVEKRGVRVILFENPISRSRPITEFARTCQGDLPSVMKAFYFPIEDDRDFLLWLCHYNQQHPADPVAIRGVDTWERPWEHQMGFEQLANLIQDTVLAKDAALMRDNCYGHSVDSWKALQPELDDLKKSGRRPNAKYYACSFAMREFRDRLLVLQASLEALLGKREYLWKLMSIDTVIGYQDEMNWYYRQIDFDWRDRDFAQYQNVLHAWEQEGLEKNAVLFMHTSHVSKDAEASDWWKLGPAQIQSAGAWIAGALGNAYKTVAITGYKVTGEQGDWATPTAENSLNRVLHERHYPTGVVFVDSRGTFARSRDKWFIHNENSEKGSRDGVEMKIEDQFDGLFHFDLSPKGVVLPRGNSPWEP